MDPVAAKSAAAEHITERGGRLMPFELGVAFGTCVGTRPVGRAIFVSVVAITVAASTSVVIFGATATVFKEEVFMRAIGWRTLVE
jgi:hypothetical protein